MANITTSTTNTSVDYISKDFNSIQDGLISYATIQFGSGTSANRLWTDFNSSSFSRNWLEIVAYVSDLLMFYLDVQATEAYLQTATLTSSVYAIAAQFGFTPATAQSSSGNMVYTWTGTGTIPPGTNFTSSTGQNFFNLYAMNPGTKLTTELLQGSNINETFTATGLQSEQFSLIGPNVIQDLTTPAAAFISPKVSVNGSNYTLVNSLLAYNSSALVFTIGVTPSGVPLITFGDGVFGRKLVSGDSVQVTYRTGGGSAGNISNGSTFTPVSSIVGLTGLSAASDFSGGTDAQTIQQLRQLIPQSLRTLERAVSSQDYSDILLANFPEVFAAQAEQNTTTPGVDINVYVVPSGAGITKITDNTPLVNRITNFLDIRKMVTVQYQIADAFGIDVLISLEVYLENTASKTVVTSSIISALQKYFNLTTGGKNSSGMGFAEQILLADVITLLEGISGVSRFEIKRLSYRPRIQKNIIGLLSTYSASDVTIYPNIEDLEWLLAASGTVIKPNSITTPGNLFSNTAPIPFTYTSSTGAILYTLAVDLSGVSPGDLFRDGLGTDFTILAVDTTLNSIYLAHGLSVNTSTGLPNLGGSIRNGRTSYETFKVFKKINATATNLSITSITDSSLDVTAFSGTGTAIGPRTLLDNGTVYQRNTLSTGRYLLVDAAGNIWTIVSNDSNTIHTSFTALNNASISTVTSGIYLIVDNYVGKSILFQNSTFTVIYNTQNTFYATNALFNQIGTIGDTFSISSTQHNVGNLGVAVSPTNYNSSTKSVLLNGSPDLSGVSCQFYLIDSANTIFNISAVDNRSSIMTSFNSVPLTDNNAYYLTNTGLGSSYGQGFEVSASGTCAAVALYLKRMGNAVGSVILRIVGDDPLNPGLPDLTNVVALSVPVGLTQLPQEINFTSPTIQYGRMLSSSLTPYQETFFTFAVPPMLTTGTQYHLILSADSSYNAGYSFNSSVFSNSGPVSYSYDPGTGIVQFASSVDLSAVLVNHYFEDGNGNFFKISNVSTINNNVTISLGQTVNHTSNGNIFSFDAILEDCAIGAPAATYPNGQLSRFDGTNWYNSSIPPAAPGLLHEIADAYFTIQGPKTIKVASNLTPAIGGTVTISTRYYDDESGLSFILGFSGGEITSASNVNAYGKGTVGSIPNSSVDTFVFRTSRYSDDIINLRLNEIPEIQISDIVINAVGGVE